MKAGQRPLGRQLSQVGRQQPDWMDVMPCCAAARALGEELAARVLQLGADMHSSTHAAWSPGVHPIAHCRDSQAPGLWVRGSLPKLPAWRQQAQQHLYCFSSNCPPCCWFYISILQGQPGPWEEAHIVQDDELQVQPDFCFTEQSTFESGWASS